MKKLLLLLLLLWRFNCLKAQSYIPFPDSAVIWVNANYDDGPGYHVLNNVTNYCMPGLDTTINSNIYSKLNFCGGAYKGGIRDNQIGKVYFIPKDSIHEFLLYDFSLHVGDTVTYYIEAPYSNPVYSMLFTDYVQSVGTITANGINRKTLSFGGGISWIEGIGNTMGLFAETWMNVSNYSRELYCMSIGNTSLFQYPYLLDLGANGSCSLVLETNEIKRSDLELSVFPNPNNGKFQLKSTNQNVNLLEITDVLGNIILKSQIQNETTEINLSDSKSGIYIVKTIDSKGNSVVNRIVKQ